MWGEVIPSWMGTPYVNHLRVRMLGSARLRLWSSPAVPEGLLQTFRLDIDEMMEITAKSLDPEGEERVSEPEWLILGLST